MTTFATIAVVFALATFAAVGFDAALEAARRRRPLPRRPVLELPPSSPELSGVFS